LPERRALFNGCEIGHRAPSDWAEIPDANASSDRVDRPVSRRHALGWVFAQHGKAAVRLMTARILLGRFTGATLVEQRKLLKDGWLLIVVEETVKDVECVLRGALKRLQSERQAEVQ
jgi:hypothetical protein